MTMDDPRRDAVEAIDSAIREPDAVQHFLDMADQIQAQLEGMSAMLVEFRLPAVENEEEDVEPSEPGGAQDSQSVTVSLNLALSTIEQIFNTLEQGGDFYTAGSTLTSAYGSASVSIAAPATEGHEISSVLEDLRKASDAIRTIEQVSESVVPIADSSEAGMHAQIHSNSNEAAPESRLPGAGPVQARREAVRAGRTLDIPSFVPRKKALEEARARAEEAASIVPDSAEAYNQSVAMSRETLASALAQSQPRETVSDHLQSISRLTELASGTSSVAEQMVEAIEMAGAESIIRDSIFSTEILDNSRTASTITRVDTTIYHPGGHSSINLIEQVVSLGDVMHQHLMESLYLSGVTENGTISDRSIFNYGSTLPAGHGSMDIRTYEAIRTPIEVFTQMADSVVARMTSAAPQLAPVRNVPRGLLPAIGSVQVAPAEKEKPVSHTANFNNTFNITVNVSGGSEEAEMKELGRKIGQILSEELKRYGGM
ncbi:hypothetical protein [Methanocella arvoryzae]|uniref:Uncharacterized protein n=1 Tax=Methanocella arvoryzae (strain DSM 22066 / NBRC 105507 / MRE50) TaxID=351160 RepID=Q0W400_METAR|nr:hypothetical protein [Methanocella arvoryzae]CAJ36893.1 hypothetical protein RCIX1663 [Methanocella arvoryzae MRE50]